MWSGMPEFIPYDVPYTATATGYSTGKTATVNYADDTAVKAGKWIEWRIPLSVFAGVNPALALRRRDELPHAPHAGAQPDDGRRRAPRPSGASAGDQRRRPIPVPCSW